MKTSQLSKCEINHQPPLILLGDTLFARFKNHKVL